MRSRPVTDLLAAVAGPLVWAAYFAVLYAGEALSCTLQRPAPFATLGLLATVAALVVLIALLARQFAHHRRSGHFRDRIALLLTMLSLLALAWTAGPIFAVEACKTH